MKIDRSFVFGLDSSPASCLMVEAVVRLGRLMDIEVVAEGVESQEEFETLTRLGCPLLQGSISCGRRRWGRWWSGRSGATLLSLCLEGAVLRSSITSQRCRAPMCRKNLDSFGRYLSRN